MRSACALYGVSGISCRDGQPLTLANLVLVEVPELVDVGCVTRGNTLCKLNEATHRGFLAHSILSSLGIDFDNADSWVIGAAVVLTIAEVADPRLQSGRIVLVNDVAVGNDFGIARDGTPLARVVEESKIDMGVILEIVGLPTLGIGVENQVNTSAFLNVLE